MASPKRFGFGKNWKKFATSLREDQIHEAERSLLAMLDLKTLEGKSFLDIGCGSGLFSLSAARLGAQKVHSFDYDADSVECTRQIKLKFGAPAVDWSVEQGSVLDKSYLEGLGQWDVVYSWGVLHHTGNMWQALGQVWPLVKPNGYLFLSLYNDQGAISKWWTFVKRAYNLSVVSRLLVLVLFLPYFVAGGLVLDLSRLRNPVERYSNGPRGMSYFYDIIDWLGGYPFEVARPDDIEAFFASRGFQSMRCIRVGNRLGCNQFVFVNAAHPVAPQL